MLAVRMALALAAILISFCASKPVIRVQNHSKQSICYKVEYSNGTGAFPSNATCGGAKGTEVGGFWLKPGQSQVFNATGSNGVRFNGAITAVLENNSVWAARNEINLLNASLAWYDVDYQYGISGSTCGPANDSILLLGGPANDSILLSGGPANGSSLLSGESDPIGKVNKAWRTLNQTTKSQLLAFPEFLTQDGSGTLTNISMGINAWPYRAPAVIDFFQNTAGLKAYMSPGGNTSVWPEGSIQEALTKGANLVQYSAPTEHIVITSY
ncbi:MAG: hypothetical protein ASARMPREDX12_006935 [Alectoria sarmentosa]|nr:MAG: hypothetical protein ASARMPREDX12_006935 [Alectoria sarmentosa]